jgi:hypothetical protein
VLFFLVLPDANVRLDPDVRTALRGGPRTKAGGVVTGEEPILDGAMDGSNEAA